MDLILNEKQYIEKMLELGDCSPKDLGANIALLTRYMYQEKYTQKEIYNGIEEFASKVDSDFDINNWYSFIDKCIGKAKKRDLLSIDYIPITQKELDTIKEIKNPARERLAFTLLVIAKFNNLKSETNNNWINYSMDVYFNLARVTCKVDDRPYMIICKRIKNRFSFSAVFHQFILFQNTKLVRNCGLCHIQYFRKIADTHF